MISHTSAYCRICGDEPTDEVSLNILRQYWCPDDGWKIGALCPSCNADHGDRQPREGDFAYGGTDIDVETDEDPILAL